MTAAQITVNLGEEFSDEGTLGEALLDRAANKLVSGTARDDLRRRIEQIRDDEIREQLRPTIAAALDAPVQLFNEYGSPKGDPITLRDLILERGTALFKVKAGGYGNKSPLDQFITEEIDRQFKNELNTAMKQAREQVLAAVREQGAAVVQETISRMART